MKVLFSILSLFLFLQAGAQPPVSEKQKDSLLTLLKQQTDSDTTRAHRLIRLSQYYISQTEFSAEGIAYINEAFRVAAKNGHRMLQAFALLNRARIYNKPGYYRESVLYADSAVLFAQQYGEKQLEGRAWWTGAIALYELQLFAASVKYSFKALAIAEEINDKWSIPGLYGLLSGCFHEEKKYEEALLYQRLEMEGNRKLNRVIQLPTNTNSIAETFIEMGLIDSAFFYNREAEKMVRALGDTAPDWQLGYIYGVRASIHEKKGDMQKAAGHAVSADSNYKVALGHYLYHLSVIRHIDSMKTFYLSGLMIGDISTSVARIYFKLGRYPMVEQYLSEGIRIALAKGQINDIAKAYGLRASLDSVEGDFADALKHFRLANQYRDSIYNEENSRKIERYQNENYFEKKEKEMQLVAAQNKLKATRQKQKRNFAYVVSGLVLAGSGYGVYRYRRVNKQKMEQRRLKERLAISQDLHDQVGSTLSSIAVYSKVAQVEGTNGNTEKMNELLDRIRNTSGKIMTEMNDIVWAINPQNDSMEKIIQRMESFSRPLLSARNIRLQFHYDLTATNLHLEMEQRKNFFLIFKEAVNNAIKYSGASLLETSIRHQHGLLELTVNDNGVGFNLGKEVGSIQTLTGNGLKNMYARAKEMNANLQIETAAGKGTFVKLLLPVI